MDMKKLCNMLIQRDDLKDIPIIFVLRVACAVFEIIDSGDCYKDKQEKDTYV